MDGGSAAPHHSSARPPVTPGALPPEPTTQAPDDAKPSRSDAGATRARGRFVRLLLLWAALAAALFALRGFLDDPFWRSLALPVAFAAVVVAGVLTVRAARVRVTDGDRRSKERRFWNRRGK